MIRAPMTSASAADNRPLRVMRVLTRPNLGGPTKQAIALWHAHQELQIETLLVTGAVDAEETVLSPAEHRIPASSAERPRGGWLQLPEMRRAIDPWADLRARRRLRLLIRAFQPDVVHTHTSKAGSLGRRAAAAEGVPVVAHTFHGHVLDDYFGPMSSLWLRRLERRLARRSDLLFAVSESCADELAAHRVAPRSRFCVMPPAVPAAVSQTRAEARARLGVEGSEWRVAALGRLVPIKRLDAFIDMVAGDNELRGDLLGDGPLRRALRERAQRRCQDRVRLLGAREDAASLLPAYDAVVLPSVREGCPLVAVEAFAASVPVVGFDVPGVRDALSSLGRGLLVPPEEGAGGLRRAVRRLRQDPALRAELVDQAAAGARACRPAVVAAALAESYRRSLRSR
ncbi:MAG: hypothetical protein CMJ88_11200 [Planctomycetes bacterium]|nr:hypothetical protein [Planctomycetota bacterium]